MKKNISLLIIIFATTLQNNLYCQRVYTNNTNMWWMYSGDHAINKRWGLHAEAQLRMHDFVNMQQVLVRPGINYHINTQTFLSVGYCFVQTYPYGAFAVKAAFPEHRLWQQLQHKSSIGSIESVNRIRLEQRWNMLPLAIAQRYSVALDKHAIHDKSVYITCFDEAFINFGKHVQANVFDQNRIFGGIGYKVPKWGRLEFGYLNQLLIKPDGLKIENNHTILLSLLSNIALAKK
jgi:hypothetical protein